MLTQKQIEHVENTLGYTFSDKSLLLQAFVRSSFCNEREDAHLQSNEVLEFFGDSVLSAVLVSIFIRDFAKRDAYGIHTDYNEGELSTLKSNLSDKKNLSRSMRELGLAEYLVMGNGDKGEGIGAQESVLEDLYESLLGAIYIDCKKDMATMIRVVEKTLDYSVYLERRAPKINYKNLLQEYCQDAARRYELPIYEVVEKTGPEEAPRFTVACRVEGRTVGYGEGKNKKEAEKNAAGAAYRFFTAEQEKLLENAPNAVLTGKTKAPLASHETPAARLYQLTSKHPELGEFADLGAKQHPAFTPTSPRYLYTYRWGECIAEGEGRSKDDAKHDAAEKMLKALGFCK